MTKRTPTTKKKWQTPPKKNQVTWNAAKKREEKKVPRRSKKRDAALFGSMPHIDPSWSRNMKKRPPGCDSADVVRCAECADQHELRARRMFNGSLSDCPKCGHKVYATITEAQGTLAKAAKTRTVAAAEAVLPQPVGGPHAPGVAVFVKWPPGEPRRGILTGYNRNGKPVVAMCRVNHRGAYTGEIPTGKGRTFEPGDIVGPVHASDADPGEWRSSLASSLEIPVEDVKLIGETEPPLHVVSPDAVTSAPAPKPPRKARAPRLVSDPSQMVNGPAVIDTEGHEARALIRCKIAECHEKFAAVLAFHDGPPDWYAIKFDGATAFYCPTHFELGQRIFASLNEKPRETIRQRELREAREKVSMRVVNGEQQTMPAVIPPVADEERAPWEV